MPFPNTTQKVIFFQDSIVHIGIYPIYWNISRSSEVKVESMAINKNKNENKQKNLIHGTNFLMPENSNFFLKSETPSTHNRNNTQKCIVRENSLAKLDVTSVVR